MFKPTRLIALLASASIALFGLAVMALPTSASVDNIVGRVYINNNTAPQNTVSGFYRHAGGSLTPIPGSPFVVGGAGTGSFTGSQGAIQRSADGRYLLIADAGSNQVSVARINANGTLSSVERSPVASGGRRPISIAVHDSLVYVANTGAGGSSYAGFRLADDGSLLPIDGGVYVLPDDALPGQVLFNPAGDVLIGVRVGPDAGPSYIDSFTVNHDGTLTKADASPFYSTHIGPFGSAFRPYGGDQLFVTNAHDGAGKGSVSTYNVENGRLAEVPGSPAPNGQTGTCWLEISPDGRYVYAVNTGSATISSYAVAANGSLTLIGNTALNNPGAANLRAFDLRLDPTGKYLYVVEAGVPAVAVFSVNDGMITEMPGSPASLPAGVTPFGIVVD